MQLWPIAYEWLLYEPYENEVTLREQNLPLKCWQPLEMLFYAIENATVLNGCVIGPMYFLLQL